MTLEEAYRKTEALKDMLKAKGYEYPHVSIYLNWHGPQVTFHITTPKPIDQCHFLHGTLEQVDMLFDQAVHLIKEIPMAQVALQEALDKSLAIFKKTVETLGLDLTVAPVQLAS